MAKDRLSLDKILCEIIAPFYPHEDETEDRDDDFDTHCYFNPPASLQMSYPCFRYYCTNDRDDFADGIHYRHFRRYTIIAIDLDPDSLIPDALVARLPYCGSDRNYVVDGLYHFSFTLFY